MGRYQWTLCDRSCEAHFSLNPSLGLGAPGRPNSSPCHHVRAQLLCGKPPSITSFHITPPTPECCSVVKGGGGGALYPTEPGVGSWMVCGVRKALIAKAGFGCCEGRHLVPRCTPTTGGHAEGQDEGAIDNRQAGLGNMPSIPPLFTEMKRREKVSKPNSREEYSECSKNCKKLLISSLSCEEKNHIRIESQNE